MQRSLMIMMVLLMLTACAGSPAAPLPAAATLAPTLTVSVTSTPSPTPTDAVTPVPTSTLRPTPTATPTLVMQGPGVILCPILLYHRIANPDFYSEYYVPPEEFRAQMQALKEWGYTSIPLSLLVKAIQEGAPLPERPLVISFDDGDITIYATAFPIMQEFGFSATVFLVVNYLQLDGYLNYDQVKELLLAGWEVGSHSMTHDASSMSADPTWEMAQSRAELEKALGVSVETFAYPFGMLDDELLRKARIHYGAALGLGTFLTQGPDNLYYLWRRPVKPGWDLETFGSFLPWNEASTP